LWQQYKIDNRQTTFWEAGSSDVAALVNVGSEQSFAAAFPKVYYADEV